jgi:FG-GAP-like repeat/Dockerin type I domain
MKNVGNEPAGICVLDVDGDGDIDIVCTNHAGNNMALILNNGNGTFANATFFEGGGNGEYAVASADMNNDGILDLVIGTLDGQQVIVQLGNGNGTFTALPAKPSGGNVWQIGTGDMNGDGLEDVHVANSFANNGAILFNTPGGGGGVLGSPHTYSTGSDAVATDVGDVDGDGDLDWCISYFSSASWTLFLNNGAGTFTSAGDFSAPAAGSCASFLDIDNDGRLDLALADELSDVVIVQHNLIRQGDVNCDGVVNIDDLLAIINAWGPCANPGNCAADVAPAGISGDGVINIDDLLFVINHWG